jgi:hypothetical protein
MFLQFAFSAASSFFCGYSSELDHLKQKNNDGYGYERKNNKLALKGTKFPKDLNRKFKFFRAAHKIVINSHSQIKKMKFDKEEEEHIFPCQTCPQNAK